MITLVRIHPISLQACGFFPAWRPSALTVSSFPSHPNCLPGLGLEGYVKGALEGTDGEDLDPEPSQLTSFPLHSFIVFPQSPNLWLFCPSVVPPAHPGWVPGLYAWSPLPYSLLSQTSLEAHWYALDEDNSVFVMWGGPHADPHYVHCSGERRVNAMFMASDCQASTFSPWTELLPGLLIKTFYSVFLMLWHLGPW